jgi:hypothetical protein
MLPACLIVILSFLVFLCIKNMLSHGDDLHALAFIALYVYTIFAQIGYAYFPEFSIFLGAYFGIKLFYYYWLFMFLSFLSSFLLYKKVRKLRVYKQHYIVKKSNSNLRFLLFWVISIVLYLLLYWYFKSNRALFGWGGGSPMGSMWFVIGFRLFTLTTFFSYIMLRNKLNKFAVRAIGISAFIFEFIFFINVCIAAGNRSDIVYFFVAISFYELSPIMNSFKLQKKKVILFVVMGVVLTNALLVLLALRTQKEETNISAIVNFEQGESSASEVSFASKVLVQDYYSPSHPLFISMHYGMIDPIETFKSNLANSVVLLNYPYLSQTIVSKVDPSIERGGGWAYHMFIEGYNALGWLGIFYNGIAWNLGLGFWLLLSKSNNVMHNKAITAVMVFLIVNTMRSQTSAFVLSFWMILLPGLWLFLLSTNSKIRILKKAKYVQKNHIHNF